jgi:hypothetical protein
MSAESTKRDTICIRYESIIERFPRNYSILICPFDNVLKLLPILSCYLLLVSKFAPMDQEDCKLS